MDRRLPAGRTDRRSPWWVWLLMVVILLATWYWVDRAGSEPAPAPAVEIDSPPAPTGDGTRIERPGREPRQLERPDAARSGDSTDDGAGAATSGQPPVPLSPRS